MSLTTASARDALLSILSLATDQDNQGSIRKSKSPEESRFPLEQETTHLDIKTKLKLKSLCDEICSHLQKVKMNAKMVASMNEDDELNEEEEEEDFVSKEEGVSRSRQSLDSVKSTAQSSDALTLRMALGSLNDLSMSQCASTFALLISDRIDRDTLLPVTQDEQGQIDILTSANVALTLSTLSISSAKVYLHMISMQGAWSVGLVDVSALSSLSAMIKRWSDECRGREKIHSTNDGDVSLVSSTYHPKKRGNSHKNHEIKKRRKVSLESDDENHEIGIWGKEVSGNCLDLDDGLEVIQRISFDGENSSFDLIKCGLDVGLLLSDPLYLKEFRNWGIDAKDFLTDSIITMLATLSALSPTLGEDKTLAKMNKDVIGRLRKCIVTLLTSTYFDAIKKSQVVTEIWSPRHRVPSAQSHEEGTLGILRALYPFLTFQASLPNGVKGKVCAYDLSKVLLEDALRVIDQQQQKDRSPTMRINDPLTQKSPLINRSPAKSFPKTPISSSLSRYSTLLKKDITPKTSRKALPDEESNESKAVVGETRTFLHLMLGMMQKMMTSPSLNKSDARERTLSCIAAWLYHVPTAQKSLLIAFADQMCRSKISCHRLVGCEIIGRALSSPWFWATINAYYANENIAIHPSSTLASDICILFSTMDTLAKRLLDRVPAVRARAASCVETIFEYLVNDNCEIAKQESSVHVIVSHCSDLLINFADRVHSDSSAHVRKSSVTAYTMILHFLLFSAKDHKSLTNNAGIVNVFARACSDFSVSVRRAAVEGVTAVITFLINDLTEPHQLEDTLGHIWAENILPLISDDENSCASQVVASFIKLILDPIIQSVDHNSTKSNKVDEEKISLKAWMLLSKAIESSFQPGSTRSGTRALHAALAKSLETYGNSCSKILKTLLKRLHVNTSTASFYHDPKGACLTSSFDINEAKSYGSWCLLEAIFQSELVITQDTVINPTFLIAAWKKMFKFYGSFKRLSLLTSLRSCLKIMSRVVPVSGLNEKVEVASCLMGHLAEFSLNPQLIGDVIFTLAVIHETPTTCRNTNLQDIDASKDWLSFVYEKCENVLYQFVSTPSHYQSNLATKAIFTVGELSMVGYRNDESDHHKKTDGLRRFYVQPSTNLVTFIQGLLLPTLPQAQSNKSEYHPDYSVRAHAFVALGKLCIRDEILARESVDIFAQEMGRLDSNSTIQNNALLILGDLLKKYTHLITKYMPMIESFLQFGRGNKLQAHAKSMDESCLVRRQAVLLLSTLILQGYIKLKGTLYYRFLIAAVDENLLVSNLATLTLCGPLQAKYPKIFYNNFVETLFVLNSCESHPIRYAGVCEDHGEMIRKRLEYLAGDECKGRRMEIYRILLAYMSDEEKIGVTARLAKEILAAATESRGDLANFCHQQANVPTSFRGNPHDQKPRVEGVLADCFEILTSPYLRITRSIRKAVDENEMDSSQSASTIGPTTAQLNAVKGRLLTNISRKQLIEIVLPILNRLKGILEVNKSPLLKALMTYMVCIFRQFKTEVREILASEPTLLQELEYDTKKFEKECAVLDSNDMEKNYTID